LIQLSNQPIILTTFASITNNQPLKWALANPRLRKPLRNRTRRLRPLEMDSREILMKMRFWSALIAEMSLLLEMGRSSNRSGLSNNVVTYVPATLPVLDAELTRLRSIAELVPRTARFPREARKTRRTSSNERVFHSGSALLKDAQGQ
jgi:hypothetical protein